MALITTESTPERWLQTGIVRKLSELSMFRSVGAILFEWLFVISAIGLHQAFSNPAVYFISVVIIGSRMYAFYSLMHDGMHFLLSKNKRLNDLLAKIFLAGPLFLSLSDSRVAHLKHHNYLKTDADPEMAHLHYSEFQFPHKKGEFLWILIKDVSGYNFIRYFLEKKLNIIRSFLKESNDQKPPQSLNNNMLFKVIYYALLFSMIIYAGFLFEFVIYWIVPYITVYQLLNRLRLSTEHFNIEETPFNARSVRAGFFERVFLFPHNINYHIEHHLFPSVPFYRLPDLSALLMTNGLFKNSAYVSNGFAAAFSDIISSKNGSRKKNVP